MHKPFSRVAIVNRGEPAMRLITAARELSREREQPLHTVALYTDPDRRAMFVREADSAVHLGPATVVGEDGQRRSTYLDYERLEQALRDSGADAAWVGWGFVAEHAAFAELCERLGIVFIGPSADAMRKLGDKITSKRIAEEADVPVAPWSRGDVPTVQSAREHAERLGYPLLLKATAGGGGRGIRLVRNDSELEGAFERARAEARASFGDERLFIETLVAGARHVEVQIIGDSHGTVWALGVRDCTVQRRKQKVIEEAPSPALSAEQDRELREAAERLGRSVGYVGAGTVEFLYDDAAKSFAFMEVNTRLQVEHPVTEMVTGVDLVKMQVAVAAGDPLPGECPPTVGHAIEVRLCAEDAENSFAPSPGTIERFRKPTGPGMRVDSGFDEGDVIPADFDSMIAKLIVFGRDRDEALARLSRGLYETWLTIRGGMANTGFLLDLLDRPEVRAADYNVGWLDGLVERDAHLSRRHAEVAIVHAAIVAYEAESELEHLAFLRSAMRERPSVEVAAEREVELSYNGCAYELVVSRLSPRRYRVRSEQHTIDLDVDHIGSERGSPWAEGGELRLSCSERAHRVQWKSEGSVVRVEVDGVPHRVSLDAGGTVRAGAPAVVVSVAVSEGDTVAVGDRLAVLEAMKTEMPVVATFAGRVREVHVIKNVQVAPGAPLFVIEPSGDEAAVVGERVDLEGLHCLPPTGNGRLLRETRSLMLGWDADVAALRAGIREHGMLCDPERAPDDAAVWTAENDVLEIFLDVASLFRRQPELDISDDSRLSSAEYFMIYLRDVGARGERLPASFVNKLERALAHYHVDSLEPTAELREALLRIFKSRQRRGEQIPAILSILQRRLDNVEAMLERADDGFRQLLDRLVTETQTRFHAVNDVARETRYRFFEQPALEATREEIYQQVETHVAALAKISDGGAGADGDEEAQAYERERLIGELVACPQPLKTFLSQRMAAAAPVQRRAMLEVMVRRYYRLHDLSNLRVVPRDNVTYCAATFSEGGATVELAAAYLEQEDLALALGGLAGLASELESSTPMEADFYVLWPDIDEAKVSDRLAELLGTIELPPALRSVSFGISSSTKVLGARSAEHFTFERGEDGAFAEDERLRGLHPSMRQRLHLWRLDAFNIERIVTVEDIYLFRCVARENPGDERLIACAEVRDLTPKTDAAGRVVALPHLERMLLEALAALRRYQAGLPPRRRLHWNRVQLFVWPPLAVPLEALNGIVRRLSPATEGLGIERVLAAVQVYDAQRGSLAPRMVDVRKLGHGVTLRLRDLPTKPMEPLSPYTQKVVRLRQRGLTYPYELINMLTPARDSVEADFPQGRFVEHDLAEDGERLEPVEREPGNNVANVVVGVLTSFTAKHPEGLSRVAIFGDPSKSMGSLTEAECRRINAALALASEMQVPVEWYAISAGAKIAMDSGTENMDWIALTLRRIVEFTQRGGEINIVVVGINVGAQPYWNAEATMLMHTRGVLIMTEDGAMVLTGKRALDFSGGVSAEDNFGIGGYERIMGPNGQAQYYAPNIAGACQILLRHYEHTYVAPGERFPRRAETCDANTRDVCAAPHNGQGFKRVGDVFTDDKNPGRKRPFDIRSVMRAASDEDHEPLERWFNMRHAEVAVVWDVHLGGYPVCMLGLESRPLPRLGFVPGDGPEQWTAGTLFPQSSKKVARAINAASGNRPVVILANLSGFDGSPNSMRMMQLEYGAEIGRAVVNFKGPMIFCVVQRYHGGAFVVFSNRLNEGLEVAALEGTRASVIGGAPAAAVVFARDVNKRTQADPRLVELNEALRQASGAERVRLRARLDEISREVHSEKLGEAAEEFDRVHSIQRAREVGSVHHIIAADRLRPYLIEALERGMARELERIGS